MHCKQEFNLLCFVFKHTHAHTTGVTFLGGEGLVMRDILDFVKA